MNKPRIITLTGPSCAGKSEIEKMLSNEWGFRKVISTTTRLRRVGETGNEYFFVSEREFANEKMVEKVMFAHNWYGVSEDEINRVTSDGCVAVLVVEPQGLIQIKEHCIENNWEHKAVFIDASLPVLLSRMAARIAREGSPPSSLHRYDRGKVANIQGRIGNFLSQEVNWKVSCSRYIDMNMFNDKQEHLLTCVRALASLYPEVSGTTMDRTEGRESMLPKELFENAT